MAAGVRDTMVEAAVVLLAKGGYQATSFSTVLEASGAPRGSIYHHFPEGKDQLIAEAVRLAGHRAVAMLDSLRGRGAVDVTNGFLQMWRSLLLATDFRVGCSVAGVTSSTPSGELRALAGEVFGDWRDRIGELLVASGIDRSDADAFAALLIASSEGAVLMARAANSLEPFDSVAAQVLGLADRLEHDRR